MPRIGVAPTKGKKIKDTFAFAPVTVCTIVYIPSLDGFWADSLEVLKVFFESLYHSTTQPFDLMVFDNGSCPEVLAYLVELREQKRIQYLILSQYNYQKLGALNDMLSIAPGEYIAYADSDIIFFPGWLEKSLEVMEAFPEAGYVSAIPLIDNDQRESVEHKLATQDESIKIETGELIPERFLEAHRLSIGVAPATYQRWKNGRCDARLTRNGTQAYCVRTDFQFLLSRKAAKAMLPLPLDYTRGTARVFEKRMTDAGLWRLSTADYLVHHMGNHLAEAQKEIPWMTGELLNVISGTVPPKVSKPLSSFRRKLLLRITRQKRIRRLLKQVYLRTYQLLFETY